MGPNNGRGSYFEWMGNAQQPNLSMIETYQDDSSAAPTGSGAYDNPCVKADFVPNFRKMRFGLATALLNDGFFSYEMNTNGHGGLCLMWFDEYDNAGKGRGYLGQPLGPAKAVVDAHTTLGIGGGMDSQNDLDVWGFSADQPDYSASVALDTNDKQQGSASAHITIDKAAGTDWHITFFYKPLAVKAGKKYTLTFWAKADSPRDMTAWVEHGSSPYEKWMDFGSTTLGATWKQYTLSGTSSGGSEDDVLNFGLGQTTGQVWLDGIQLQSDANNIWRRDYTNGIVLVNPTSSYQTFSLGGEYRKIAGEQSPLVNDGSLVNKVTLQPHDGLILLNK